MILHNKIFWLCVSAIIFWWTYAKFEFNQLAHGISRRRHDKIAEAIPQKKVPTINLPNIKTNFSFSSQLKTSWKLSTLDFRSIVLSWCFIFILFSRGVLVLFQQYQMGSLEGIVSIPTTTNMLRFPIFFFTAIINLLTFLYVGVLIYKGRLRFTFK